MKTPLAVILAEEVLTMHYRVQELEAENERLLAFKQRYDELLNTSVQHSREMMASTVGVLLTPGVSEAFFKAHGSN